MSVQSEFFEALLAELKARGLSDEVANENVSKFKSQLSERAENDEYIDAALSKIPPASIAENIYNMLRAESDEDAGAKSEVMVIDTDTDTMETTIKEGKDAMSPLSDENGVAQQETSDGPAPCDDDPGELPEQEDQTPESVADEIEPFAEEEAPADTENADDVELYNGDLEDFSEAEPSELAEETDVSESTEPDVDFTENTASNEEDTDFSVYSPTYKRRINDSKRFTSSGVSGDKKPVRLTSETIDLFYDEDETRTSWVFIVMAVFLIPLFCVLGAIAFAIVLGLWVALAVVIAVLLLALVGIVVAGTAYSVLGLIFGIIEAFSGNAAAAVFEVGLALCVGGVVMFIGIWVYNFAIRFIPFIIKKLGVLLVLIFKLFKKALVKLKALCRKI